MVHSEEKDWSSVCKADSYFEDVRVIDTIEEFIELINRDRDLIGMDVAKYILSKIIGKSLNLFKIVISDEKIKEFHRYEQI